MKKIIGLILLLGLSCTERSTKYVAPDSRPPRCVVPPLPEGKRQTVPIESDRTPPPDRPKFAPPMLPEQTFDFNVLVLLVDFPDKPFQTSPSYFDRLIFGDTGKTFKTYYLENSYGAFNALSAHLPSATGVLRLPQTYSYYTNGNYGFGGYPQNAQRMAQDAILAADPLIDFSQYDNNGDGIVDGVIIIHAGSGAELTGNPNDIWSHQWSFSPLTVDGKTISDYCTAPEYWSSTRGMQIGVIVHEAGHLYQNLIDLYDPDGSSQGDGRWTLMAQGAYNGVTALGDNPAPLDAWSKKKAGFVAPVKISASGQYSIADIRGNPQVYQIGPDSEPFLLENRQSNGYDSPGSGLLIWHVKGAFGNRYEWYPGLNADSTGHYFLALKQADGLWQLEKNLSSGNAGDPYPGTTGNTRFDSASVPNSNWYGGYFGVPSGVNITNISASGPVMSFTLGTEPPPPPDTATCPGDMLVTCGKKQSGKIVTYPGDCSPPSGFFFPVGTTIVDCTGLCAFNVTVRQTGKQ